MDPCGFVLVTVSPCQVTLRLEGNNGNGRGGYGTPELSANLNIKNKVLESTADPAPREMGLHPSSHAGLGLPSPGRPSVLLLDP